MAQRQRVWVSGLLAAVVASFVSASGSARQLGDNFTVILPAGKLTNLRQVLVVTKPKPTTTKVGDCKPGAEVRFFEANLLDREGKQAPVPTEVAIVYPGASGITELKPGWRLGSWRAGGKCGPGYEAFVAHVIGLQ